MEGTQKETKPGTMQIQELEGLCPRCVVLFASPKDNLDVLLMNDDGVRSMLPKLVKTSSGVDVRTLKCMNGSDIPLMCPLCYNVLTRNSLERMKDAMIDALQQDHLDEQQRPIYLNFIIPPVVDTARLTARLIVSRSAERTFAFPPFQLLLQRLMSVMISCDPRCKVPLTIVDDMAAAGVQINVLLHFENQTEFCQAMVSDFKHKTKKRRLGEVILDETDEDAFEVSRNDSDRLLLRYKSLDDKGINELKRALDGFMTTHASAITWTVQSIPRPIFLLGRYRKLARDVPQSCWTIGEERRGRNSVEEIVSEALVECLQAKSCKLHPCGREDIDVRCLGNGRPFVVQVTQARAWPVEAHITAAMTRINAGKGLNDSQDVEVPMLKLCDRSVWEQMQTVAEEKRKAYSCICWSARPLTKEKLKVLEDLSVNPLCVDEEGRPSLKIIQKTPLRVLHRRSLLDRPRYIYNIETILLNDHYFIMNLRTSAGTYVKEFVHGDLGRTAPSVCSLLGCQADILQLDVVWLFDDFEGGGEPLPEIEENEKLNGVQGTGASSVQGTRADGLETGAGGLETRASSGQGKLNGVHDVVTMTTTTNSSSGNNGHSTNNSSSGSSGGSSGSSSSSGSSDSSSHSNSSGGESRRSIPDGWHRLSSTTLKTIRLAAQKQTTRDDAMVLVPTTHDNS